MLPQGRISTFLGAQRLREDNASKIIAGLISPSRGEIWVKGKKVDGPGPERAFVFQDFALLPWANVFAQCRVRPRPARPCRGKAPRNRPQAYRRGRPCVFRGETGHPHQLSGGHSCRQRVGLARALAVDADIILMDEPFSSVDEQTRRKFQEELLDLLDTSKRPSFSLPIASKRRPIFQIRSFLITATRNGYDIIHPNIDRKGRSPDEIRRDKNYLDVVDEIWQILKHYV